MSTHVNVPAKKLPSGASIPVVGLGVYESGAETYDAVISALKLGYRHIDTAQHYKNEADVGRAVRDSGVPRDQVFVTSKVFKEVWSYDDTVAATKESVERLGLGCIDLFLLHAPTDPATRADAWRALEDMQSQGFVRDIGVSNYGEAHLDKLAKTWKVKPAVNQVELHPWLTRSELVKYHQKHGILLQAYSPLARSTKLVDPVVNEVAQQVNATPAQVLIAWSLAKDFVTLPKSVNPDRQRLNLEAVNVKLTDAQVAKLDALDEYLITGWDPIKNHAV